jgi:hypothetical protein
MILFAKNMHEAEILIWYDGPVLSHYTAQDAHYIVSWVDDEPKMIIWHAIEISSENLKLFMDNKITLLQVMQKSRGIFRCINDFIDKHKTGRGELIAFQDINPSLLPTDKSFLSPADAKV